MERWTSSIAKMSQSYYHHVLNYGQVEMKLHYLWFVSGVNGSSGTLGMKQILKIALETKRNKFPYFALLPW